MGRYRTKLQITADILRVVRRGARKTQIMRQARLSYTLLCRYLTEVAKADLVYRESKNYLLTRKGEKFLNKFHEYSQHCEHLDDHLDTVSSERVELEEMCSLK